MIGLHDADDTRFPNLALMKISAAAKVEGKETELIKFNKTYDKIFSSKVFTFTPEIKNVDGWKLGGFGRGLTETLPEEIEHICPDYSLYGINYSLGFLTRGCPNKCSWCFIPEKEGDVVAHAPYTEFVRHREVVFMDNNVLACDHGINQIIKIGKTDLRVDFNQGFDARFIDNAVARLLAKLTYRAPLRLACDSIEAMQYVSKAVNLLRWHNTTPKIFNCYVLAKELDITVEIVKFLKGICVDPFVQPYIDRDGNKPHTDVIKFARWVNAKQIYRSVCWDTYKKKFL